MTARVGLFFIIGLTLIWVTFEALNDGSINGSKGYTLIAPFSTVKQLKHSDEVRMAGVKIGAVEATRLADGHAEAILRILPEYKIAKNATASIVMSGLLGANYVTVDFGDPSSGVLGDGEKIRTKEVADLNQVMADLGSLGADLKKALSSFTGSMSGGADGQGGLFQKLDRLVTENSAKLTGTINNLEGITAQIRSGQGTVGKLIYDQTAYDQLLATVEQIKGAAVDARAFITNTQGIVDQVKSGKGPLGTLVYDEASAADLKRVVQNLRELSEKLNNPNSSFGQLITNDTLIKDAQATLRKVDRAVDGLGDSAPISAVGTVAGQLF
jgi:phospholipid/cholesterol/gamma-HCH transport system substrate-binding protein